MAKKSGLLGNLVIRGKVTALTGLHIGAAADTVEIGGIDSPVIRHPVTDDPYIPGSSLKGKMRSFAEKIRAARDFYFRYNRNSGTGGHHIWQHVCDDWEKSYLDDNSNQYTGIGTGAKKCPVCRIYGSTGKKNGKNYPAKIIVRDCKLANPEDLKKDNLLIFEAKMENSIDRMTSAAHPRTFERVPADACFHFEIVLKVQGDVVSENGKYRLNAQDANNIKEDVKNIFEVLSLIEKDGLGGSISRGYGQVEFKLDANACRYYQVGGGAEAFLPELANKVVTDLEELRKNDFANLDNIIAGA